MIQALPFTSYDDLAGLGYIYQGRDLPGPALPGQEESEIPGSPLVVTSSDQRMDCSCRGGAWIAPENRCAPQRPTGFRYDPQQSRCVQIQDYRAPFVDSTKSACYSGNWNLCLIGGVAAGLILLYALVRK